MSDVNCPYCGAPVEIGDMGQDENEIYDYKCPKCEKIFAYTVTYSIDCYAHKADCLNGADHNFKPYPTYPAYFPERKICKDCGHVDNGPYDPDARQKIEGQTVGEFLKGVG